MVKGFQFLRKIFSPLSRTVDKWALLQQQAIEKADSISKGEKVLAPHYPAEEKLLKELEKDERIKMASA
jgi:hypothetical protein